MSNSKLYTALQDYDETAEELALIPNLDHFLIFTTGRGNWMDAKTTCDKNNALFYCPEDEIMIKYVHGRFQNDYLFIGMHFKNGVWKTCKGTGVTFFFWGASQPTRYGFCAGLTSVGKMINLNCSSDIRVGLCIF